MMFLSRLFRKEKRDNSKPEWSAGGEGAALVHQNFGPPSSGNSSVDLSNLNSDDEEEVGAHSIITSRACPPYGAKSLMGYRSAQEDAWSHMPEVAWLGLRPVGRPGHQQSRLVKQDSAESGAAVNNSNALAFPAGMHKSPSSKRMSASGAGSPMQPSLNRAVSSKALLLPMLQRNPKVVSAPFEPAPGMQGHHPLHFFAVFDGHGGAAVAKHCKKALHKNLKAVFEQAWAEVLAETAKHREQQQQQQEEQQQEEQQQQQQQEQQQEEQQQEEQRLQGMPPSSAGPQLATDAAAKGLEVTQEPGAPAENQAGSGTGVLQTAAGQPAGPGAGAEATNDMQQPATGHPASTGTGAQPTNDATQPPAVQPASAEAGPDSNPTPTPTAQPDNAEAEAKLTNTTTAATTATSEPAVVQPSSIEAEAELATMQQPSLVQKEPSTLPADHAPADAVVSTPSGSATASAITTSDKNSAAAAAAAMASSPPVPPFDPPHTPLFMQSSFGTLPSVHGSVPQSPFRYTPSACPSGDLAADAPGSAPILYKPNVSACLAQAFIRTDKEAFQAKIGKETGSTAVVLLTSEDQLWLANCGDSRAILCRASETVPLSTDHKASRPDEVARIEAAGGYVWWERVMGELAVSRAIGDHCFSPYVIAEPEVMCLRRTSADLLVILASDGLWDVFSNEEAHEVAWARFQRELGKGRSPQEAAKRTAASLVEKSLDRGSRDNVTVIVVDVRAPGRSVRRGNQASQESNVQGDASVTNRGGPVAPGADSVHGTSSKGFMGLMSKKAAGAAAAEAPSGKQQQALASPKEVENGKQSGLQEAAGSGASADRVMHGKAEGKELEKPEPGSLSTDSMPRRCFSQASKMTPFSVDEPVAQQQQGTKTTSTVTAGSRPGRCFGCCP